jgi:hypothetical protein
MIIDRKLLLPWPKRLLALPGVVGLSLNPRLHVSGVARSAVLISRLSEAFRRRGGAVHRADTAGESDICVERDARVGLPNEGYELVVQGSKVIVRASTDAGAFYGVCTLAQWVALAPNEGQGLLLSALRVEDAPDFPVRGVMLDISRDRVPRMDTLRSLLDLLASLKINQVQVYMEHTFAYHIDVTKVTAAGARSRPAEYRFRCANHADQRRAALRAIASAQRVARATQQQLASPKPPRRPAGFASATRKHTEPAGRSVSR